MVKKMTSFLSIIKSFFLCVHLFGVKKGSKLPMIFYFKVKVSVPKGKIILETNSRVTFGFGGSAGISSNQEMSFIVKNGVVVFKGSASFGKGSSIRVDNGILEIGNNFNANRNFFLSSTAEKMHLGKDMLIGWNVAIRDSDGHSIDGNADVKKVSIGDNVWIGAEAHILKGTKIGDGCVVGYASLVTSAVDKNGVPVDSVLAGHPAKVIKKKIKWQR